MGLQDLSNTEFWCDCGVLKLIKNKVETLFFSRYCNVSPECVIFIYCNVSPERGDIWKDAFL